MSDSYDVVIFGAREGQDPGEVAQRLSTTFDIPLRQAEGFICTGSPAVFKTSLSAEDSERLQNVLARLGAKVNAKPSLGGGLSLELVPKTQQVHCPVCRHAMTVGEDETPPAICPECGLVFHKYRAAQEKKAETETVRNRLGRMNSMREDAEDQRLRQEEEERRKQLLEEELRKEMGLRERAKKPWKQWAIAATLLLAIGAGGFGIRYIPALGHFGDSDPLSTLAETEDPLALDMSEPSEDGIAADSQEPLVALASAIAEEAAISSADTLSAGMPSGAADSAPDQFLRSVAPGSDGGRLGADDLEWHWLIERNIQANLKSDDLTTAARLASHLPDLIARETARARIAAAHTRAGRSQDASALIVSIVGGISGERAPVHRIEQWTAIAPILTDAGQRTTASHVVSKAIETTATMDDSGDQAQAWALIALAQAKMGSNEAAQQSLRAASHALKQPMAAVQRARTTVQLAGVFAVLGSDDEARRILNAAEQSVGRLPSHGTRNLALEQIASTWADLGDMRRAVDASRRLPTGEARDHLLLRLLQDRVFAGRTAEASSFLDMISTTSRKARAYAYLGLADRNQRLAERHFKLALQESEKIADVLEQVRAQAEIARLMAHTSLKPHAPSVFAQAEQRLRAIGTAQTSDQGWASLANHRSKALDPAGASPYAQRVQSARLRAAVQEDLSIVQDAVKDLRTLDEVGES